MNANDESDVELWMVVAIIQPFRLDVVTLALQEIPGFGGMTVTDCRGFGRGKVNDEADRNDAENRGDSVADVVDFKPKLRLEVAAAGREQSNLVVETIARAAHTGRRGDGKIFAWPFTRAVRIRTFEEGERALSPRRSGQGASG